MRSAVVIAVLCLFAGLACTGVGAMPPKGEAKKEQTRKAPAPAPKPAKGPQQGRGGGGSRNTPAVQTAGAFVPAGDPCAARSAGEMFDYDFPWEGTNTKSHLFVPEGAGPHPLVVLLHAGNSDAARILQLTRMDQKAREEGFALLIPSAASVADHGLHWNSGKWSARVPESEQRNDVAYLDALTGTVRAQVCANKVLAAGFSSGGQMIHRWACQGSQPDAMLSAAGELLVDPATCTGPRPVRGYVGDKDKVFASGPIEGSDQPSAPETIGLWASINGCNLNKDPTQTRNGDTTCSVWRGCSATTELCVVEGFPHGWPAPWNKNGITQTNATNDGWAWFEAN